MEKQEFYILNILRGVGALLVVFYHYFVFFFSHQDFSASLLLVQPVCLPDPFYLSFLESLHFDLGHFAVSFFFLISGFLILPSLERYDSLKIFLVHKVFRLWPTYFICFSLGLLFMAFFHYIGNSPFPYDFEHVFAYYFWVRDLFHFSYIDGSVWTLEIQIKFYILAALIWSVGRKNFLEKICIFTLVMSVLFFILYSSVNEDDSYWFYLITVVRKNLKYDLLILLGTCLYALYQKKMSWTRTLVLAGCMLAFFWSPLFYSPDLSKMIGYTTGFFLFSYLILVHAKSFSPKGFLLKFFTWASEISYPLYVGHVLPGYVLMYLAIEMGFNVYWGIGIALVYSLVMAEIVHKKIEVSFLRLNKKLIAYYQERALWFKK